MLRRKRSRERRNKIKVAISPAICRPVVTIGRGSWKLNYERSQEKLVFVGRRLDTIDKGVRSVSTKCKAHGIGRLDSRRAIKHSLGWHIQSDSRSEGKPFHALLPAPGPIYQPAWSILHVATTANKVVKHFLPPTNFFPSL